jgi:hypothetical protein
MDIKEDDAECILYVFPFSLYSIMARLTAAFGAKHDPENAPRIRMRLVNLHRGEQVLESYLKLNPKGEVHLPWSSR